jgi:hypothetical protein
MRAAFSFAAARRPGHEVHKEQGQNKNCPFSMGVSWKFAHEEVQLKLISRVLLRGVTEYDVFGMCLPLF